VERQACIDEHGVESLAADYAQVPPRLRGMLDEDKQHCRVAWAAWAERRFRRGMRGMINAKKLRRAASRTAPGAKDKITESKQSKQSKAAAKLQASTTKQAPSTSWLRGWCCGFSLLVDEGYPELPDHEELCPITSMQEVPLVTSMHEVLTSGPRDALLAQRAKIQLLCADARAQVVPTASSDSSVDSD